MFDVEGFILVGGQSSRMGSDKSRLVFGGLTGVEHLATVARPLTRKVRLVGSRDRGHPTGLQNIPDTHERWGALGGIQAALAACEAEWAVILACDLPLVTTSLLARMWQVTDQTKGQVFDAIVPIQPDGRPQPLCAFYRREPCLQFAKKLISQGEHKPRSLLTRVQTRWVSFDELSDLAGARELFLNVNTPGDYERAKEIIGQSEEHDR